MAIVLSKKGHYEWEAFRQELIASIADWENAHSNDDPDWDYYQRWFLALEKLAIGAQLVSEEEVERRTAMFLEQTKGN